SIQLDPGSGTGAAPQLRRSSGMQNASGSTTFRSPGCSGFPPLSRHGTPQTECCKKLAGRTSGAGKEEALFEIDRNTMCGGKTIYGAAVGILVLDTKFPRMPGDIGYAPTWPFPVLYKVVRGASGERVTTAKPDDHSTGLLKAFLEAGAELVAEGADGLT